MAVIEKKAKDAISPILSGGCSLGMKVKTGLRAGDWTCRDCEGQVSGSSMLKSNCNLCYPQ